MQQYKNSLYHSFACFPLFRSQLKVFSCIIIEILKLTMDTEMAVVLPAKFPC